MKKFFYTNGTEKIGPFTLEELKRQNLSRDTKIWFYGLENWTALSDIEELSSITNSIPPKLRNEEKEIIQRTYNTNRTNPSQPSNRRILKKVAIITIVFASLILISYFIYNNQRDLRLYKKVVDSAYETDVDFNFYLDKFYRDLEVYGIFPKKPITKIIKFAKFDHIKDATHFHGISYGIHNDDRIEIYINPSTWERFNKPLRYYLMYHELAHDILNLNDLSDYQENEGRLMYPAIASYESKSMDDFIESYHKLFEEIKTQNK